MSLSRIAMALSLPLLVLAGCATQGSVESMHTDMEAVKIRLFTLEKDFGGIRDELKNQMNTLESSTKSEIAAMRKISADTFASVDSTKSEIQALTGKLDDTSVMAKKPAEDLTRYREDADKRIILLEERILKLQGIVDELSKKTVDTPPHKEATVAPDAIYIKGLEFFKAGDMPTARERFQKFIELNPKHDLVADAHYWIGETYLNEKSYEPAILSFQELIKSFPDKEKVPAAMLKQATAFQAIGDSKSAKYVLKKLVEGWPKSEEASKAKELMKGLK